ncbi:LTA synthase family protein [Burkholderia multivorans]|nr:LTA synthase family protein [Burkholderia multivorans]MBU9136975.1 LTA synthase family protein [Burkholderia multivorans]MBU9467018.1 LTA synthase family protein [Burkholderia multivorans]
MRSSVACPIFRVGDSNVAAWLVLVVVTGIVCSFIIDALAVPRANWRRPAVAILLHCTGVTISAACIFVITARPVFATSVAVALVAVLAIVGNAKYATLREPFVFTDMSLFSQLFAHPRLYLPFLSVGKVLAIAFVVVLMIAGLWVEGPAHASRLAAALAIPLLLFAARVLAGHLSLTLDLLADQRRNGFFAVFIAYLVNGLRRSTLHAFRTVVDGGRFETAAPSTRPDVIVIQSESYFDARSLDASITSAAYAHFDRAASESVAYGELTVPAWGANTMRTEFAMLTGVPNEHLGYARFYPYAFVRRNCPSLASAFRSIGYRTRAIHPYHADFFGRDRAFPLLGFEHFIDIRHFDENRRVGSYIGDAAVTDAIMDVLDEAGDAPYFIFAMTMENHGPLHLEAVEDGEGVALHQFGDERPWRDLTAYLRHVRNADGMIGTLIDYLRQRKRDTVLCFYGDHVPALPHVYERLGALPERSNYFIWRNHGARPARQRNLTVEQLGSALRAAMDDGVDDKISSDTWLQATER